MYRKISYDECIAFVEKHTDIKLFDYQKEMLKAFCDGKEVRSARCAGRSLVAKVFGEYIAHAYDKNDYEVEPELTISWDEVMGVGLVSKEHINRAKEHLGEEQFKLEYCQVETRSKMNEES